MQVVLGAHGRCQKLSELLLVDADEFLSLLDMKPIAFIWMHQEVEGEAALPNLAAHRLNEGVPTSKGC